MNETTAAITNTVTEAMTETGAEIVQREAVPGFRAAAAGDIRAWVRVWHPGEAPDAPLHFAQAAKLIWNYPGLRATLLFRVSHALWRWHIPALPGMVGRLNLSRHGLDIPPSVEIGPGLYVPHPVGTVVMARRIGSRVSLITAITLGMRQTPDFPTLGDDVFVGAGARILGGVTIGDGASIGANAVVLTDVPPGATAVGIPAKIKLPTLS